MKKINWAVLAPGNIARDFSMALQGVDSAHLYSVASRDSRKAKIFANEYGFETYANSYDELIADPKVDVVYIASPHTFHVEQSIACLQAGKAVLCEKPMAINSSDAKRVFSVAKQYNSFYMEAVWTRFMPIYKQVRQWISDGKIGEVQMMQASFGIAVPFDETHRLYDINLAGGSLLDLGIYPITFAQWLMQQAPEQVVALAQIGDSGVDEKLGMALRYPNGEIATLNSGTTSRTNHDAWIFGTKGNIRLPHFWHSEQAILTVDENEESVNIPHKINGYEGEIEEVSRCLQAELVESPTMSWSQSIEVMNIMDEVRSQIGLHYPMEG